MVTKHSRFAFLVLAMLFGLATAQHVQAITIAASKALPDDSAVTLDNVIISNALDLVNSSSTASFEVQDATGGVRVFGLNADITAALSGLAAGDQITISGKTDSFSGLFELIAPFSVTPVAFAGVPAPTPITVASMQNGSAVAELQESRLVKLSNVTFVAPPATFPGNFNLTVTDGVLNAAVRVPTSFASMVGDPVPTGPVNITGILSQFDGTNPAPGVPGNGYQLLLLNDSSVVPVPEPAAAGLAVFGLFLAARAGWRRS